MYVVNGGEIMPQGVQCVATCKAGCLLACVAGKGLLSWAASAASLAAVSRLAGPG